MCGKHFVSDGKIWPNRNRKMISVEKALFKLYFSSCILLVFSIVTFSVPWGHWAYTLNRCTNENCGCVLYGKSYHDAFSGGSIEYCQFVTFAQIPLLVISIILTFYHGVRAYIKPRRDARKNLWRGNPLLSDSKRRRQTMEKNLAEIELEPPRTGGIIALLTVSIIAAAVLLTVLGFFMDGYFRSCKEYRKTLVEHLGASGRIAYVLNSRLICTSIFDFMDYLQPERRYPDQPYELTRRDRINTGLSLLLSNITLLINVFVWILILLSNFKLLFGRIRKSRD